MLSIICIQNAASFTQVDNLVHIRFLQALTILQDLKADNILQELVDRSVLAAFTKDELETPSPRKIVDGTTIYVSRRFDLPDDFGDVVLSDFGAAVRGDVKRNHDAQPNVYRSPEVMLMTEWSYPVDIWNVGVMVYLNLQVPIVEDDGFY